MENASKALIMAAAALIAVGLISIFMYVFTAISEYSSQTQAQQISNQIIAANRYFVEAAYDTDLAKAGIQIYGYDVYNLIGKAKDINDDPDGEVEITIVGNPFGEELSEDEKASLSSIKYTYKYYMDSMGYVNKIEFISEV